MQGINRKTKETKQKKCKGSRQIERVIPQQYIKAVTEDVPLFQWFQRGLAANLVVVPVLLVAVRSLTEN
jgi:hypothetical protein